MTQTLNEKTVIDYVRSLSMPDAIFEKDAVLSSEAITEGNVNLIFRVFNTADPLQAVLVKQALPYAWRYPDGAMPVDRQRIEYDILKIEARYCPQQVPKVYAYNPDKHLLVIEYFGQHLMMRYALMQQNRYPLLAQHIGRFMARTLFYTSDFYLSSGDKKAMLPKFINPVLCEVQERLVFTQPYRAHPKNRWTRPWLDAQVAQIHQDDELRSEIFLLKEQYQTRAQALIHNDLHTGSIMLNQEETKIIDPEFGFFGPIGHDIGAYLGNLVLSYAAQEWHAKDAAVRKIYRQWLLQQLRDTWHIFEDDFLTLWENEGNGNWPSPGFRKKYMRQLLQDVAGFGAAEMIRRLIGMAHVQDFWTIEDEQVRAIAESLALNAAVAWLKNRHTITGIEDLTQITANAKSNF